MLLGLIAGKFDFHLVHQIQLSSRIALETFTSIWSALYLGGDGISNCGPLRRKG